MIIKVALDALLTSSFLDWKASLVAPRMQWLEGTYQKALIMLRFQLLFNVLELIIDNRAFILVDRVNKRWTSGNYP